MRKPSEFSQLISVIQQALELILQNGIAKPERENFVLTVESIVPV
jgi:hypothetical protein